VASDFFTTVTVGFRVLYVFVVLEVGTRRILHWNVTEHPTAEWTIQQFRTVITPETSHRFVLHDRDSIFAATVDRAITSMGRHVLKTPVRTPQANHHRRMDPRVSRDRRGRRHSVYDNAARSHASLEGHPPLTFAGGHTVVRAQLNNVRWVSHCRELVQPPVAA
jgi:hypothetical protein